jgi:hypothetical protein
LCASHAQLSHDIGRRGNVALTLRRLGSGAAEASLTVCRRLQLGQENASPAADGMPQRGAYACTVGWVAEEGPTLEVDARVRPLLTLTLRARRACCFAELASGCFAAGR